jgi:hypothetical protein
VPTKNLIVKKKDARSSKGGRLAAAGLPPRDLVRRANCCKHIRTDALDMLQ